MTRQRFGQGATHTAAPLAVSREPFARIPLRALHPAPFPAAAPQRFGQPAVLSVRHVNAVLRAYPFKTRFSY